jgi:regulator of replication initiation timing
MISKQNIVDELEDDIKIFEEKLNVVRQFRLLLSLSENDIKFLTEKNKELTIENEVLKANLRDTAEQLRGGVSKIQQKTLARAIEEFFGEKK